MSDAEALCEQWKQAKEKERRATELRREIEDKLIEILGRPTEGKESQSHKLEGATATVKCGQSIKVDLKVLQKICVDKWNVWDLVTKTVGDQTAVKKIRKEEPKLYEMLVPALTVTPSRESVTIKFEEE